MPRFRKFRDAFDDYCDRVAESTTGPFTQPVSPELFRNLIPIVTLTKDSDRPKRLKEWLDQMPIATVWTQPNLTTEPAGHRA